MLRRLSVLTTLLILAHGADLAQSTTIRVRDRAGTAVGSAEVELLSASTVMNSSVTDDKGVATIAPEPGVYRVRVTAPGFVVGLSESFNQTADVTGTTEVSLFPGSVLKGSVLDGEEKQVPGAELCLRLHDRGNYPPQAFGEDLFDDGAHCIETDERGQVVSDVLPLGEYDLAIEADGMVPRTLSMNLESGSAAQQWRLTRGGQIRGRLEDAQEEPVAGAAVRLRHREIEAEQQSATDEQGKFDIAGLAAGPWSVRIEPRNAAVLLRDGVIVREGAATDLGSLRLRPGLDIEGRVTDDNGEPLADVEITVRQAAGVRRPLRKVTTDDDGQFIAAGLGEETVNLYVNAPAGHASILVEEIDPPERDVEIELLPTGSVCGHVLTEEGNVAGGIVVTAVPVDLGPFERYANLISASTRQIDPESGQFCVDDVHSAEAVRISAKAAGYQSSSSSVDLAPGEEAGPVELTLKRGLALEGTVVDSGGQPLRDVAVRARDHAMVYTDGFGEFRLRGLQAGMNKVYAEHADHAATERDVMLPLGDDDSFVIELGAGGTIEGRVLRGNGEAVEGVPVALSTPDREQRTDRDGRFRFDNVPPGERTVTRKARNSYDDFEHRKVEVVAQETIEIEFNLGTVLEGQVLRGGVPTAGVSIVLAQPGDVGHYASGDYAVKRTFSDESGDYRLAGVRPGWGTVTLETPGQTVVRQLEIPTGDEPRRDLQLPHRLIRGVVIHAAEESGIPGASISVTLAASDGAPQSGSASSYSNSDESGGISYNLTTRATSRTQTDDGGNFEVYVDPLPETKVRAWAQSFRSNEVTVDPDSREAVRIDLFRDVQLIVILRDEQGQPARRTKVCVKRRSDDGTSSTNCQTGGTGEARFSLGEGRYKILASAAGFGAKVRDQELSYKEDGSAHTLELTLRPGAPLDLRLAGQPLESARVVSLSDAAGNDRTDLVGDGTVDAATGDRRWQTWTLEAGIWTVRVDPGDGELIVREVEVVPGAAIEVLLP